MTILSLSILLFAHLLPWLFNPQARILLSPFKLASILSAIHVIPHFVIVMFSPERTPVAAMLGHNFYTILSVFGLLYSLGMMVEFLGIFLGYRFGPFGSSKPSMFAIDPRHLHRASFVALGIYLLFYILTMHSAGGVVYFVSNMASRAQHLSGTGFYAVIMVPALYLAALFAVASHAKFNRPNRTRLFFLIILLAVIHSTLGARRAPMQVIIFAMLAMAYLSPRFRLVSVWNGLFSIALVCIFVGLLVLRYVTREGFSSGAYHIGLLDFIMNLSYNDIYIFILHYFDERTFWYGSVFSDLYHRLSPYSEGLLRPPVDEGMYVYNNYLGYDVRPPEAIANLFWSSWPPNTFGSGYANFGAGGVIAFSAVRGVVIGLCFSSAKRTGFDVVRLSIFLFCLASFHVSNLRIVMVGSFLLGIFSIVFVAGFVSRFGIRKSVRLRHPLLRLD